MDTDRHIQRIPCQAGNGFTGSHWRKERESQNSRKFYPYSKSCTFPLHKFHHQWLKPTQGAKLDLFSYLAPLPKKSSPPPSTFHLSSWRTHALRQVLNEGYSSSNLELTLIAKSLHIHLDPIQEWSRWITRQLHLHVFPFVFLREALRRVSLQLLEGKLSVIFCFPSDTAFGYQSAHS